ncbi:hypothetical protein SCLCIDRAFT_661179 [Scleroderma citrinum Foug A]|uniref:Uncharacterized protein n=1 Tax=Scleroderma citrinum Foug A TaxID=1036808 RepID=A0A0C2ZRL6_9AGAM|nr:hypothetical protein SCLCIDRAFT_661179 [Scleroderma citrinum Foug A]
MNVCFHLNAVLLAQLMNPSNIRASHDITVRASAAFRGQRDNPGRSRPKIASELVDLQHSMLCGRSSSEGVRYVCVTRVLTRSLQPEIWHAFLNNRTFILRFNMRSIRVRDDYQEISNMYPALLFSDPTCGQFGLDINTVNGTRIKRGATKKAWKWYKLCCS